ncbi:putative sugar transport system permease protein, partial [Carnobacterium sp. AT7]
MHKIKLNQNTEKKLLIFLFTIIPVALLLLFSYYPLIKMFQYSLTDWNGITPNPKFVGADNYRTVLTNPNYFAV